MSTDPASANNLASADLKHARVSAEPVQLAAATRSLYACYHTQISLLASRTDDEVTYLGLACVVSVDRRLERRSEDGGVEQLGLGVSAIGDNLSGAARETSVGAV